MSKTVIKDVLDAAGHTRTYTITDQDRPIYLAHDRRWEQIEYVLRPVEPIVFRYQLDEPFECRALAVDGGYVWEEYAPCWRAGVLPFMGPWSIATTEAAWRLRRLGPGVGYELSGWPEMPTGVVY